MSRQDNTKLVGKTIGFLKVIKISKKKKYTTHKGLTFIVECTKCNKRFSKTVSQVKKGQKCYKCARKYYSKSLLNKIMNGHLLVTDVVLTKRSKTNPHAWKWKCICQKCGKVILGYTYEIKYKNKRCMKCHKSKHYKGYKDIPRAWLSAIKKGARERNIKYSKQITCKFLWDMFIKQDRKCALTGVPIEFSSCLKIKRPTASVDRISSKRGYYPNNIQLVHKNVNLMKRSLEQNEFIDICRKVVEKHGKK